MVTLGAWVGKLLASEPARGESVSVPRVVTLTAAGRDLLDEVVMLGALAESVSTQKFGFVEGPVWSPTLGKWFFSDIPGNTMYEFDPMTKQLSTFRTPSNHANGNFLDNDGRLLTCEHKARSLTRTDLLTGERTVLAASFDDKPLTSPNDCVVSRKTGSIYFTDPAYGTIDVIGHGGEVHQPTNNVYRLDPTSGEINLLDSTFAQPNGLCFSPDETLLYVSDSGAIEPLSSVKYDAEKPHRVKVFDVVDDGKSLANGRTFYDVPVGCGVPDGIRNDALGNLWCTTAEGVHVISPAGELIAKILTPMTVANCAFGGPTGSDLMMTASESCWVIKTKICGSGDLGPA